MGFDLFRGDAVVLGDLAVDAEEHWLFLNGEVGPPDLALDGLHSYPGDIGYLGHVHHLSIALAKALTRTAQVVSELVLSAP